MSIRRVLCGLGLLLLAGSAVRAEEGTPLRLGLVIPLAGDVGPLAGSMRQAAELAAEEGAAALGRPVQLLVRDDVFDPTRAVDTAEAFVREKVWGVVGHFHSSSSIPAAAVYHAARITQITPSSTHPYLTGQGFDTVFRVVGRDDRQAETAADFALSRLRARRVAVLHDRTEYGRTLAEGFARAMRRRQPGGVVFQATLAQGDRDFAPLIVRLRAARPDAIYFGGIFREAGHLLRQLRQAAVQAPFLGGDGIPDPEFALLAGESALRRVYCTLAADPLRLESARPLLARFEARHGSAGPYVVQAYDAVGVLLAAIRAARPRDGSPAELGRLPGTIRRLLYHGALGDLRWDRHGDLQRSPYVVHGVEKGGSLHGWFTQLPSGWRPDGALVD